MTKQQFNYYANGLQIRSEIAFPEFLSGSGETDVTIRYGKVPDNLDHVVSKGARFQAAPGQYLLRIDGVARYWVREGREIIITAEENASEDEIKVFVLSSALGALAHQRGLFPLHAGAIISEGQAILFAGKSGAGKSTLVARFYEMGYPVLSDNLVAIDLDKSGRPIAYPGYTHFKLWADSLQQLNNFKETYPRVRPRLEKYSVGMNGNFQKTPVPIGKIYILSDQTANQIEIFSVTGRQKVNVLLHNTFRQKLLAGLGQQKKHFEHINAIARQVLISRISRPPRPFLLDPLTEKIEVDIHV